MLRIFIGILLSHNAQNHPMDLATEVFFALGYVTMVS